MAGLANYLIYYANKTPAFENCPKNTFPSDCSTQYVFCVSTHDGAPFLSILEDKDAQIFASLV